MDLNAAKQTFLVIKRILDKEGIKFWLVDGTALGAVRSGDFIGYDEDIDLRVMAGDWDFSTLFKKFEADGFRCVKSINRKLYGDMPSGSKLCRRGVKVDICLGYHYPPDDAIVVLAGAPRACVSVLPAKLFRGDYWTHFVGERVRVPNPPEEYLEIRYGKNWRIPAKGKWHPGCVSISLDKYVEYFKEHNA